jgi:hypothetical protein
METPEITKIGTIDIDLVETTPLVFGKRLLRFEYVRQKYWANDTGDSYFRFIDLGDNEPTKSFATGYHLGSAYAEGDWVYAYGIELWGRSEIRVFRSKNLVDWEERSALKLPGWGIYNTSVCRGDDRYVMAIELGEPPELVGKRFTIFFAESRDLLTWRMLPVDLVHSRDRYTACPVIRFVDGQYYMIYLEERPGPTYEPHIVRSTDLGGWESSPLNPVMRHSDDDKIIANPGFTRDQRELISGAVNINNSDVDLCEYRGRTVINYSWGNQHGTEFLAEAVYEGGLGDFFAGFYPDRKKPFIPRGRLRQQWS